MPKTRELQPARRTKEPTHDLARKGRESSSGQTTPSGPLTERSAKRAMRDKTDVRPTGPQPADDNEREAYRRMTEEAAAEPRPRPHH